MTAEQLYEAIEASQKTITVMVPRTDYYARSGDTEEDYLTYICPYTLLEKLKELQNR